MTTVFARRGFRTLILACAGVLTVAAAHAGPQVMLYITLPLGAASTGHVFGLRLDKTAPPPNVRIINPDSPLNRRALLDLQMGANSALRLELDRRLTWDISREEWRPSSLPATFTLRIPVRTPSAKTAEPTPLLAWQALRKPLAIQP